MMTAFDVIVAIDPDVERSGVCFYYKREKKLFVNAYSFPQLLDIVEDVSNKVNSLLVVVEAGWLNKSNWHLSSKDNARTASAKGISTGRNHEVGRKLIECLEYRGVKVESQKPLRKVWANGKISHNELKGLVDSKGISGLPSRTNQDQRDAILLAITR